MIRVIILAILLAQVVYAVKTVAVLEIIPTGDVELKVSEYRHLTDELRTRAREALPRTEYAILTRDNILSLMPPDSEEAECLAESCAVDIGRAIGAEYVTQGFVGEFDGMLTLTVELYESISGNLVGSFVTESNNLRGLLSAIREKSTALFANVEEMKGHEKTKTAAAQSAPKAKSKATASGEYKNFSTGRRWGTWALNWVPGLGSITLMKDWTGALIQWGLFGSAFLINEEPTTSVLLTGWMVYNIVRSASYDKPYSENQVSVSSDDYSNFSKGRRWGTFGLNSALPGLGSIVLMNDWGGAIVQWLLYGGGIYFYASFLSSEDCDYDSGYYYSYNCTYDENQLALAGASFLSYFVFNIVRSATYDKPSKTAYNNKYGDFNVAVLPNQHGKLNAYLMYNKSF